MPKIWILVAAFSFVCITKASADQSEITCEKVRGMIAGPMVPTEKVAKEIYLAVAHGRGDKIDPANVIKINDDGDHWSVFQFPSDLSSGEIAFGGGALEMTIAKCDGSILAHYSK